MPRNGRLRIITVLFFLLFSGRLLALDKLPEFDAYYDIQKFGVSLAQAHYQLSYTDSGYLFRQNSKLVGLASLFGDDTIAAESIVDIDDGILLLKKHRYIQTGREKNRDEDFSINWSRTPSGLNGHIQGIVRSKPVDLDTTGPIWEALSFQLPLMTEANTTQKDYPYKALLKGEIDTYNFHLSSRSTFSFAGTDYDVLVLVRVDPEKDRQLHLWLAPQLNNVPVVVENYRDGKLDSRMRLSSITFNKDRTLSETEPDDEDDF